MFIYSVQYRSFDVKKKIRKIVDKVINAGKNILSVFDPVTLATKTTTKVMYDVVTGKDYVVSLFDRYVEEIIIWNSNL